MRVRRHTWRSGYWRILEEAELPYHPVDGILLDVDIEDQSSASTSRPGLGGPVGVDEEHVRC
jgi:hypothetical protein